MGILKHLLAITHPTNNSSYPYSCLTTLAHTLVHACTIAPTHTDLCHCNFPFWTKNCHISKISILKCVSKHSEQILFFTPPLCCSCLLMPIVLILPSYRSHLVKFRLIIIIIVLTGSRKCTFLAISRYCLRYPLKIYYLWHWQHRSIQINRKYEILPSCQDWRRYAHDGNW